MAIATIRPDSVQSAGTSVSLVGAATANAAISDQNNSTYIQRTGSAGLSFTASRYGFADPGLSNVTVRSVNIYAYAFTHNFAYFGPYLSASAYQYPGNIRQISTASTTPVWTNTGALTAKPGGGSWAITDVNNMQLYVYWDAHVATTDITRIVEVYAEIDYARAPGVPTAVIPANGASVGKPNPDLSANLTASGDGQKQYAQWQFATNTGFTTGVVTISSNGGVANVVSGTVTKSPTTAELNLAAGTWYMRARGVDQYGIAGAWSATATVTISHIVGAVNLQPTGGTTVLYGATNTFSWTFAGASSTSTQSAYQIIVERNDTGAAVADTGKVTSSSARSANIALGAGNIDVPLRWKIQLWDGANTTQGYGAYSLFTASAAPIVTITAPADGGTVTTGKPTVTWTNDAGTTQKSRRVVFKRSSDGSTLHDSGTLETTDQTYAPATNILSNGLTFTVTVTVVDTVGLSGSSTNTFTTSYVQPTQVTYSVDASGYEWDGDVTIDWSGMTPDASFSNWNVYRRESGTGEDWTRLLSTGDVNVRQYSDYLVPSNDYYEYAVTQGALRSGEVVESGMNQNPLPVYTASTHYWLIDPLVPSNSLRLSQVTEDSYTEAYDQADLVIIGRGRKVNQGTRAGYDGTLKVQLRDDDRLTARQKRQKLQALRSSQTAYYLRNPFGDSLLVSLGDLQFARIPGVGVNEWVDVSIPYKEVF